MIVVALLLTGAAACFLAARALTSDLARDGASPALAITDDQGEVHHVVPLATPTAVRRAYGAQS